MNPASSQQHFAKKPTFRGWSNNGGRPFNYEGQSFSNKKKSYTCPHFNKSHLGFDCQGLESVATTAMHKDTNPPSAQVRSPKQLRRLEMLPTNPVPAPKGVN